MSETTNLTGSGSGQTNKCLGCCRASLSCIRRWRPTCTRTRLESTWGGTIIIVLYVLLICAVSRLAVTIKLTNDRYQQQTENHSEQTNTSLRKLEVSYVLNIVTHFFNVIDHIILTYTAYKFLKIIRDETNYKNELYGLLNDSVWTREALCPSCEVFCLLSWTGIVLIVSLSFAPTILQSILNSKLPAQTQIWEKMALVLHWISHAYNLLARLAMIIATLVVKAYWSAKMKSEVQGIKENYQRDKTEKFCERIEAYNLVGDSAAKIQDIFQAWFVVKWIIYFVDITVHSTRVVKAITEGIVGDNDNLQLSYVITHLAYDFIFFATIYVCGTLMNSYHEECYTYLKGEQREYFFTTQPHATSGPQPIGGPQPTREPLDTRDRQYLPLLRYTTIFPLNPAFQFTPSIGGVHIPMDNSGYTLTLLLALFAFIFTFVTNLGDYNF